MKLVVVESPAKVKTINKYLGNDFKVIASFGHIRDLPSKNGSVLPEKDFAMKYDISDRAVKYVNEIVKLAKQADEVYLATDPDREGESISWHVVEVLKARKIITEDTRFKRIAFNEITKKAVLAAVGTFVIVLLVALSWPFPTLHVVAALLTKPYLTRLSHSSSQSAKRGISLGRFLSLHRVAYVIVQRKLAPESDEHARKKAVFQWTPQPPHVLLKFGLAMHWFLLGFLRRSDG